MSLIRDTLIQIRKELGFENAKAFYRHLESRGALEFNYAHYMKIEGDKALPSPAMINAISASLNTAQSDRLTLAYCATLFPNKRRLFKSGETTPLPKKIEIDEGGTLIRQQTLSESQVAALCRSELHYSLFLILTLARGPVSIGNLQSLLKTDSKTLLTALADLEKARLTRAIDDGIESIAKEMRFPKAETVSLRKLYEQIDLWNFDFDKKMEFESVLQKMMIRRVSARYLGVIQNHCQVLMELIRAAEEINPEHNDDVLMFNLTLSRGKLPG